MKEAAKIEQFLPGSFEPEKHWYPKVLNATIHPLVNFFLNLDTERIVSRYCHLNPKVNKSKLEELLSYKCSHFLWGGADLISATSSDGEKQMVIIENNSCPSGQKSMPLMDDNIADGTYRVLIERSFKPLVEKKGIKNRVKGCLAVFYDKNYMETSGYASVIADVFNETVHLVPYFNKADNSHVKIEDGIFYILIDDEWQAVRAMFRYVTQKPWNRIPLHTKTLILNPISVCLTGGRNKLLAAKAYDLFNSELSEFGLKINIPDTIWDVAKNEIPIWVQKMGGHAVIKVPYSNAGQGVYTITNVQELDDFMKLELDYDRFIVQSLIGNYNWSSRSSKGKFYHVGTMPDKKGDTYVADFRMMVSSSKDGIKPICMYSRRALKPLMDHLESSHASWDILGTNLSIKIGENQWTSDTNRLMIMDRRDYNKLGLGIDELIETFIQTVLSTIAIDKMCKQLFNTKGKFRMGLFKSLNDDPNLINEILV